MALTEEQLKQGYFEALKNYTNNFHTIRELEKAPLPIQIAVEKMFEYGSQNATIKSESISDLSTTYRDIEGMPQDILNLINPYCKARLC